jgi:hypothetical protein
LEIVNTEFGSIELEDDRSIKTLLSNGAALAVIVGLEGRDALDPHPTDKYKLNADESRRISRENGSLFLAIASLS